MKKDVLVKRSSAGLGLFTNKEYKKGDEIIEYLGETITADEGSRRGGKYLFELNERWMIDGKSRSNIARYINHSCRPNAYPELSSDETQVKIFAKKKITVGEEITYHYGPQYFKIIIKPIGCQCEKCTTKK
jgi:SET domain-containing protein